MITIRKCPCCGKYLTFIYTEDHDGVTIIRKSTQEEIEEWT